ncbi:hypothetical protein DYB28_004353 [Aphanomyces astaci]|uniref:DDE-1 domain-containing protein n=1 Tax=Aphanomyces astaci TaxID=112090 RepID=A0A9X8EDD3_APHAT|nr:hypothetical protein DYB28_004353 [Aphanomyces astaci]
MSYLATKKSDVTYDSLLRLLRRFCQRYGFSRQRHTKNKLKQAVLTEVHDEFARDFHREYQSYEYDCVFNENAWMDAVVWRQYLRDVLGESIEEPSVVLMDNFECHVSDESFKIMHEELGSHLCALPPNATSVCQPFDVGVMAPFKRNLRNLWLYEEQLEGDDDDPYSPTARQKRMAMVLRAIAAWDMVTADVIRQAFAKALRVN